MDATETDEVPPIGELVLLNTRHRGLRRALAVPVTLIGSGDDCDVCLKEDSIDPLHCIIAVGPNGPTLRTFDDENTRVNGRVVSIASLHNGDKIHIGPFEFELSWQHAPMASASPPIVNSLRIQAAAVVSQQAALIEEEWRIQQNQTSLEQQHQQVARHLDERHQQLITLQEQLTEWRSKLRSDREQQEEKIAAKQMELEQQSQQLMQDQRTTTTERDRLLKLRRRFLKRWKRHWATQRRTIEQQSKKIERERQELAEERQRIDSGRMKINAKIELDRQHLREQFQRLETEQAQLLSERERLASERRQHRDELEQLRQQTATERLRAEQQCRVLKAEVEGLDARIRNSRNVLESQESKRSQMVATLEKLPQVSSVSITQLPPLPGIEGAIVLRRYDAQLQERTEELNEHREQLGLIAEQLSDQRAHLIEQFGTMLQTQQQWQMDEFEAVVELETLAQSLAEQEQDLRQRQEQVSSQETHRQQQLADLMRSRTQLESQWLRFYHRDNARRADDERIRIELDARTKRIGEREARLSRLLQNWSERRQTEMDHLRIELERCVATREQWSQHLQTDASRESTLSEEQRKLAEQALILEQARQEILGKADNASVSEKKLERLQRRLRSTLEKREAELSRQQESMRSERESIEQRFAELQRRTQVLLRSEGEWSDRLTEYQKSQHMTEWCETEREHIEQLWTLQRAKYEQQITELQNEIERLAVMLIESAGDETNVPMATAA